MLNFGGQQNELWCKGGEYQFIRTMIFESEQLKNSCLWFTTLVSKKNNLRHFYKALEEVKAEAVKTIEMKQGQKVSRVICWTFLNEEKKLTKENIIIQVSNNINVSNQEFLLFLDKAIQKKENGTSFVVVYTAIDIDDFPENFNIVPTLQEAEDVIDMENMERELGF